MSHHDFAVELVRAAGGKLGELRAGAIESLHKGEDEKNVVTSADLAINRLLIERIRAAYPEHRISSEEGGSGAMESEYEWVLDPIDGSANFARSIPHFAVCAALLRGGEAVCAAVYNPVTDELFSFEKGVGAFVNGAPARVSGIARLEEAQVLYVLGHRAALWEWGAATYRSLVEHGKKLKALGSSSLDLCFLGAGRAEVVLYGTLTARDAAGAIGFVREAGGEVYALASGLPAALTEEPQPIFALSNRALLEQLLPHLHRELLPQQS